MVWELHVWGPAFGLPSIDPECLATITYFTYAIPRAEWALIASSASAVPPGKLPALFNPSTKAWTSGFHPITATLRAHSPRHDLDVDLSAAQTADTVAHASFLALHAGPLLSLSLYVSSANWASATRPAFSAILPFPLTWTEPPALRAAQSRRAEHLGLSSLDTDADGDPSKAHEAERHGFLQIPPSLRKTKASVSGSLTPEQAARIKLDGLADDVFSVLSELKDGKRYLIRDGEGEGNVQRPRRPASLDCLAFGYLALMLLPEVPRPFLRESLRRRYVGLCAFVEDMRREAFEGSDKELPWTTDTGFNSPLAVGGRFLHGVVGSIPEVGAELRQWWARRRKRAAEPDGRSEAERGLDSDVFVAVCGTAALVMLITSVVLYRRLPAFGSPVYRYERQRAGYRSLGALGAALGLGPLWGGDHGSGGGQPPGDVGGAVNGDILEVPLDLGGVSADEQWGVSVGISAADVD